MEQNNDTRKRNPCLHSQFHIHPCLYLVRRAVGTANGSSQRQKKENGQKMTLTIPVNRLYSKHHQPTTENK